MVLKDSRLSLISKCKVFRQTLHLLIHSLAASFSMSSTDMSFSKHACDRSWSGQAKRGCGRYGCVYGNSALGRRARETQWRLSRMQSRQSRGTDLLTLQHQDRMPKDIRLKLPDVASGCSLIKPAECILRLNLRSWYAGQLTKKCHSSSMTGGIKKGEVSEVIYVR